MPYVKKYENNYEAFNEFEERCLRKDQSLIWPDKKLWTLDNLKRLKSMYGDESIEGGDKGFEGKLELQLERAEPELWGIIADLFYVYTLPSSSITFEKKLGYIRWAAEKAGFQLPDKDNEIWDPFKIGYVHTGIQYNMKFGQLLLIILFSIEIKESTSPEIILRDSKKVQDILDNIVEKIGEIFKHRPRDMRQIILYYKFPEKFESIISTTGKENIIQYYSKKFSLDVPDDPDEALFKIRNYIEKDVNDDRKPIHFYHEKYKIEWDPNSQPVSVLSEEKTKEQQIQDLDPQLISILHALKYSKNLILSGPPGTGKTYLANKSTNHLIEAQINKKLSTEAKSIRVVEGLTFYDILALDLFINNKETFSVPEIEKHDLIESRYMIRPVENPRQSIWNNLQTHTAPISETVKVSKRSEPFLFDKDENSNWFLTDEGRKYVEQNLADKLDELQEEVVAEHKAEDFIRKVIFHQSFAYEDFIEGIRPRIGEEESGEISYEIFPGVFSEISRMAQNDPDNRYVLIIDEINRGNISKIFGELITLIEDDKRDVMSVKLPYSKRDFVVPENLYLIGTMNTADRSIALMDVALRRRFAFIEMMPRLDLLEDEYVSTSEVNLNLGKLLDKLNDFIETEIDQNHQIGHSYFLRVAKAENMDKLPVLTFVWNHQIFPLLKEYFYSQHDKLIEFLSPFTEEGHEGDFEEMLKEGDDLLFALKSITDTKTS
ncbi:MAG: AAA family ATPase [Candidatus Helarchaeota archaeon]